MKLGLITTAVVGGTLLATPLSAASAQCAATSRLVQTARSDFAALGALRMQPGICTLRKAEYKCRWAFPGDAFAVAEAQAANLLHCAAGKSASPPQKLKRGETAIALEEDLSLIVGAPRIDMGQWLVTLRIVAQPAVKP